MSRSPVKNVISVEQSATISRPSGGLVTFLFSDIEGSTERWERDRDAMREALGRHDRLLRGAIERRAGQVFKTMGDQFCAAFFDAEQASASALDAQRALRAQDWSAVGGLHVRMALHTGVTDERDGDYFGPTVNRVARLLALGRGGQVLLSGFTADLVRARLPRSISLHSLGSLHLKGLAQPERVFALAPADETVSLELRLTTANNLPLELTQFLGRERELTTVRELVTSHRLVTLTGTGGVGKTRTALRTAASLLDHFDGIWFVELAPLQDPGLVTSAIAQVLHVLDAGDEPLIDRVIAALKDSKTLIVVDNCEHVISAAAGAVEAILRACPGVRALATSREPLAIGGEHVFRMPSLEVPAAVALFADRASSAAQEFELTPRNAPVVAEIVRRLDGIPLAIELAAPKLRFIPLDRLVQRLDERFELLTGGSRTALPRQQTLRALIDWSYDLLDERDRALFRRISAFRGGWTLEATRAVCGDDAPENDVLEALSRLVDKSLVVAEDGDDGRRYRMLESTRDYAAERLAESGETDEVAARHCRYFCELSNRLFEAYWTTNRDRHMELTRAELENYRAAIDWGLLREHDVRTGARIVANLRDLWDMWLCREGRAYADRALELIGRDDPVTRARLLLVIAAFTFDGGLGLEPCKEAVELARETGDAILLADALRWLGNATGRTAHARDAIPLNEQALAAIGSHDVPRLRAAILSWYGFCLGLCDEFERGRRAYEEAVALLRQAGDALRLLAPLTNFADLEFKSGNVEAALQLGFESIAVSREFGTMTSIPFLNVAAYLLAAGRLGDAWENAREGLLHGLKRQRHLIVAIALQHLAQVAARQGDTETAARLVGYADAAYASERHDRHPTEKHEYERIVAILRNAYAPSRLNALLTDGRALSQDAAVKLALAIPKPVEA